MWKSMNLILASCRLICPIEHLRRRTSNLRTLDPILHYSCSVCP